MSPPDASACRTVTCSSSLFSSTTSTSPAPLSTRALFLSLTRPVSAILSLCAFILAFPVKVLSHDLSGSLSAFVVMWLCRSSVRCKRCASWAASNVSVSFHVRRQDVESSGFSFWRSFHHNPWQWGSRSFFVSCDFLCQLQFWSHHLPRSATQAFPVRLFPSITQCLSCPTFASHNHILGNLQNCSCSFMMTIKDSLSHAAC